MRRRAPQLCRHLVRRVPIEVVARAVVGPSRAGIGMSHGVLHVLERNARA
jgi:hypothetical protein